MTETSVESATGVDFSGVEDACDHLDNCGLASLADAVRGLDGDHIAKGREIDRLTARLNEIRAIATHWQQASGDAGARETFRQIIKLIDEQAAA